MVKYLGLFKKSYNVLKQDKLMYFIAAFFILVNNALNETVNQISIQHPLVGVLVYILSIISLIFVFSYVIKNRDPIINNDKNEVSIKNNFNETFIKYYPVGAGYFIGYVITIILIMTIIIGFGLISLKLFPSIVSSFHTVRELQISGADYKTIFYSVSTSNWVFIISMLFLMILLTYPLFYFMGKSLSKNSFKSAFLSILSILNPAKSLRIVFSFRYFKETIKYFGMTFLIIMSVILLIVLVSVLTKVSQTLALIIGSIIMFILIMSLPYIYVLSMLGLVAVYKNTSSKIGEV